MQLGYNILLGIFVFFVLDKVVRIASGNSGHSHGHEEDDAAVHKKTDSDSKAVVAENKKVAVSSSAVLNIIADFAHNVTDGLAIGAAFATAKTDHEISAAFMTVLAILMHELPHELGDIALLIKSGMSRGAAIGMQVFTAIGCVVGSILGVLIESSGKHGKSENQSWIIPFTAGGFLYIALAVIIPELLSVTYQGRKGSSFRMGVLQIVFLYAGIYFMQEMSHFE
jgi:zinc transporter 7